MTSQNVYFIPTNRHIGKKKVSYISATAQYIFTINSIINAIINTSASTTLHCVQDDTCANTLFRAKEQRDSLTKKKLSGIHNPFYIILLFKYRTDSISCIIK